MILKKEVFTNILSIWIHGTFVRFEFLGLLLIYALCDDIKERTFYKHSFDLNSWNIRLIWILGSFVNIHVVWWYQRKKFLQTFFQFEFLENSFDFQFLGLLLIYTYCDDNKERSFYKRSFDLNSWVFLI